MRVDQWFSGVGGLSRLRTLLAQTKIGIISAEPTVTVAGCSVHCVCVIDAESAFDHLVRESAVGHCRQTAQELIVIGRSMQTLRARCRWVPHERMVVDALTNRHGNSVAMLRLLRDGALVIGDEDQGLAMRKTCREKHKRNLRHRRQVEPAQTVEWDRRNAVECSHTIQADEASRVAILEPSLSF